MTFLFNILVVLIAAAPVTAYIGAPIVSLLQTMLIGLGALALAIRCRQTDTNQIAIATHGILPFICALPVLIVVQLMPVPLSWGHPIWTSVAEALPGATTGHITVDIGRTLNALIQSIALIGTMILGVVVARDRRRAELIMLAASAVATLLSLAMIFQGLGLNSPDISPLHDAAVSFAGLGIVLNAAVICLAIERRETRGSQASQYLSIGTASVLAMFVNGIALFKIANAPQWTASGFGFAILLLLLAIRRLALSRWAVGALCLTALVGAGIVVVWLSDRNADATGLLRFVPSLQSDAQVALQRMLGDTRWLGSGADAFDVVARIYQISSITAALRPPSATVAIVVDTGWIGLLICILLGGALFLKLFWGALSRGRDWFFAAVAAASVAITVCGSLVGSNFLQSPVLTTLAIIVGVGLSQGFSQSTQH